MHQYHSQSVLTTTVNFKITAGIAQGSQLPALTQPLLTEPAAKIEPRL